MAHIVLLHPFPVDHRFWDPVAQRVGAAGHQVVAPDLPGFGQRAAEPGWTMNDEADRLAAPTRIAAVPRDLVEWPVPPSLYARAARVLPLRFGGQAVTHAVLLLRGKRR